MINLGNFSQGGINLAVPIPVNAGDRLLLFVFITATGFNLLIDVTGYVSGGVLL